MMAKQEEGGMKGAVSGMLVPTAEGTSVAQSTAYNVQPALTLRGPPAHNFLQSTYSIEL